MVGARRQRGMKVGERIDELMKQISLLKRDADKCDKGNVSASIRLRKDLMSLIKEIKEVRHSILENRKEHQRS